jgi:hypothetical protein
VLGGGGATVTMVGGAGAVVVGLGGRVVVGRVVVVVGRVVVVVDGSDEATALVFGGCVGTATLLSPLLSFPPSATNVTRPIAQSAITAPAMMRAAVTS